MVLFSLTPEGFAFIGRKDTFHREIGKYEGCGWKPLRFIHRDESRTPSPLLSRLSREQAEKNKKKLVETLQNSKYGLR
jgi:hypothetical protein